MASLVEDLSAATYSISSTGVDDITGTGVRVRGHHHPNHGGGGDSPPPTTILDHESPASTQTPTPIPKFQLCIILLIQLSEPLTSNVIYPFINQFVQRTGVTRGDEKVVGYYAGIIESIFFLAEGITVLGWQRASDRWGRRPFLVVAPLGLGVAMLVFGLSESFGWLVVARCFQGIFNGDIGISKTVMGEISDPTNRATVLSTLSITWSIGTTVAPFIGGVFSFPDDHWPGGVFGGVFKENPFFLPCLIVAGVAFGAFGMALVGLKETAPAVLLKRKRANVAARQECEPLLLADRVEDDDTTNAPRLQELMTKRIMGVLLSYGLYAFSDMCNNALQPLVWTTSVENGGLGFTTLTIGTINTVFGVLNAVVQIMWLARMLRYLGPRRLTLISFISSLVSMCMYPLQNYFARRDTGGWVVWVLIVVQLMFGSVCYGGYASILLYLMEVSPTPGSLGTLQGLGQMAAVISRALGPTFATSLFALTSERKLMGGYFVYGVIGVVDVIGIRSVWVLLPRV